LCQSPALSRISIAFSKPRQSCHHIRFGAGGLFSPSMHRGFYGALLAREATAHLERCEILLDTYARKVFAAQEENRTGQSETERE
jgi:hypothetical protein